MRDNSELRQQMFEMIERWQQSGLSQKSFCEKESVKFHSFYYWYKRYRQHWQTGGDKSGFVNLKIEKHVAPACVEIHFPDGVRLVFHETVSSDYLKSLIS